MWYPLLMKIRIEKGLNRRFGYTDRKNGYLELNGRSFPDVATGYFRGKKKFLSDFFLAVESESSLSGSENLGAWTDLWRSCALHTDVRPDGFSVVYDFCNPHISLNVSLLLDEQAFFLSRTPLQGNLQAYPGVGILFERVPDANEWVKHIDNGVTIYSNNCGTAIASTSSFSIETEGYERIILVSGVKDATWYVVCDADAAHASQKAERLARTAAITAHRSQIESFFSACFSDSGDSEFDDALRWARFSGWLLMNDENGKGIWAGLPWFRENWSFDTCVSLSGILLVNGYFADARSVLCNFAARQNLDTESSDYGRIPNRFRNIDDTIFNTADGTLWFIRALWEYAQYSGDIQIFYELKETVDIALEADIMRRMDDRGFLRHGDGDTWMDARIEGGESWSPRGDRGCEVQALWYTALRIGERIAHIHGEIEKETERQALALRVKKSFGVYFWCDERHALADHLPPGPHGEWMRDFRVRPNQLFAITAPAILSGESFGVDSDSHVLDSSRRDLVLENVKRELVTPYGLFSLSSEDPLFHPHHEDFDSHHKDASYHNGTLWLWNTGLFVSAEARAGSADLSAVSETLLRNEAQLILKTLCAGSLGENISAESAALECPVFSGTWSHAMSVAEFTRNVFQDIIGFNPRLVENRIELRPHLPEGTQRWSAEVPFGKEWRMRIDLERTVEVMGTSLQKYILCRLLWKTDPCLDGSALPVLMVNGRKLENGKILEIMLSVTDGQTSSSLNEATVFPIHDCAPEWCGAVHHKDYLEKLILSGRLKKTSGGGANTSALEWYFDSDYFKNTYKCRVPLGSLWSAEKTVFRLWAPTARSVSLVLYPNGTSDASSSVIPMRKGSGFTGTAGVWELSVDGDLHGTYYRFRVCVHGIIRDSADPYARSCGVNGKRSMVVDMSRTNPSGWETCHAPVIECANDAIVYEVHVADISSSHTWGGDPLHRRTYLGACQSDTSYRGIPTGFDHIKNLGVTHIQLLPVFDFVSVDESRLDDDAYGEQVVSGKFNWGYDPENYCAPEGSYSTNPYDGTVRIRELKTLIQTYILNGIGVIMDVVYNHVPSAQNHPLGICVPGYYFRLDSYSGAGDDTASERDMFRSYMIDSLSFWLTEYKLSGFRFDLMGLHDVETMNEIACALKKIKSDVLLYGEGWDMYRGGKMVSANMIEAHKMRGIGFFNDAFRCALKGPVFNGNEGGFLHNGSHRESVKFGLVGAVYHPHVHNKLVDGTANRNPWTDLTATSVNYTEIHDNMTLHDKLVLVESDRSVSYYERMQRTAISLVLFAQGQPVIHAGMEFMRTKEIPAHILATHPDLYDLSWTADHSRAFSHNSYNLCDRINGLDWARCEQKEHIVRYVKKLISIRKNHSLFRLRNAEEVCACLTFIEMEKPGEVPMVYHEQIIESSSIIEPALLAWKIDGSSLADPWRGVCVVVNPSAESVEFVLPLSFDGGDWHLITDGDCFRDEPYSESFASGTTVSIAGKALYLYAEF